MALRDLFFGYGDDASETATANHGDPSLDGSADGERGYGLLGILESATGVGLDVANAFFPNSGRASNVQAKKQEEKKQFTPLIIGGGLLLLGAVLFFVFKRK